MPEHLLRALLDIPFSTKELHKEIDSFGEDLTRAARDNVITLRLTEVLVRSGLPVPEGLKHATHSEHKRVSATMDWMSTLANLCRREKTSFVFTKAFQHLPDMGHDVDLLIGDRVARFDAVLVAEWGAKPDISSLSNTIANKKGYIIPGAPSPLEIHHGRMGQLGEHKYFPKLILNRAVKFNPDSPFLHPSLEDQMLIQVLQRLYSHLSYRLSDIIHAYQLLNRKQFDWDYVVSVAQRIGVFPGLKLHLAYLTYILKPLGIALHLPDSIASKSNPEANLREKGFRYVFPRFSVAQRLFGLKLLSDTRQLDIDSAGRICLLPLIGVLATGRNLFQRGFRKVYA